MKTLNKILSIALIAGIMACSKDESNTSPEEPDKEEEKVVFEIGTLEYCIENEMVHYFDIKPFPKSISEIKNADKLNLELDAEIKAVKFTTMDLTRDDVGKVELEYKGLKHTIDIQAPESTFEFAIETFTLTGRGRMFIVYFRPLVTGLKTDVWSVRYGQEEVEIPMSGDKEVELLIRGESDFSSNLTISHNMKTKEMEDALCGASSSYTIFKEQLEDFPKSTWFNNEGEDLGEAVHR